jgi:hypothetical protein
LHSTAPNAFSRWGICTTKRCADSALAATSISLTIAPMRH